MDSESEPSAEDDKIEKQIRHLVDNAGFTEPRARKIAEGRVRPLKSGQSKKVIEIASQTPPPVVDDDPDTQVTLPTPPRTPEEQREINRYGIAMGNAVVDFALQDHIKAMPSEEKKAAIDQFIVEYKKKFPPPSYE